MKEARDTLTKKVKNGHYVANSINHQNQSNWSNNSGYPVYGNQNRGFSSDREDRTHSDTNYSEYTLTNERPYSRQKLNPHLNDGPRPLSSPPNRPPDRPPPRAPSALSHTNNEVDYIGDGSDIYVSSPVYRAASEVKSLPRSNYSVATSKLGKGSTNRGAKIELMSAPNPFCPNIRGVCCLMLLLNLGLILITLGFVIVLQFYEPFFVWILGIVFLIFGFATLIGSLIFCVSVCRDAKTPSQLKEEDIYWTKHWKKNLGYVPNEISYKTDKFDDATYYSANNNNYSTHK